MARGFRRWAALAAVSVLLTAFPAAAYDLGFGFSLSGVVAVAGQCQQLSGDTSGEDHCRGALVLQPELSFHPGEGHELFAKLGFAAGDGLDDVSTFRLATWAADLEDGVRNVNGGDWDHVLTAWYRFTTRPSAGESVDVTVGIIDGTDFLDTNAYSNDEYTQFMHSALVNGPNVFVPSYAPGGAVRWRTDSLSLTGVYMRVGQAGAESFDFYAVEAGYQVETRRGIGNYRLLVDSTSESFPDPDGRKLERRTAVLVSCDQQLGSGVGAFVRLGLQTDGSAVAYGTLYSGGIELGGER